MEGRAVIRDRAALQEIERQVIAARAYHWLPLIRAAKAGCIALTVLSQWARVPTWALDPARNPGPAVALIPADTDDTPGPDAFQQAPRAMRWTNWAMVHATGAKVEHYELAVAVAIEHRARVLLIECASANVSAWEALVARVAPKLSGIRILPPPGGVHPIAERMH
jgi:hypothetical protein